VKSEFIFDQAPFASAHASTIAETGSGLIASWFGGTREGERDVTIWVSRREHGRWSEPVEVADGLQEGRRRFPCWNPVLYQPATGPLLLFYKVGPSPGRWWGMVITSEDDGRTWSSPRRLPDGILGPIKNKPVALDDGYLLCPSSTEHDGWRIHLEGTPDLGRTWQHSGPLNDGKSFAAIQPCILTYPGGRMQILCRSRQGKIAECWTEDGANWTEMRPTTLPNPDSGIDAVTLTDGRALLVYNHVSTRRKRFPLNVAISSDGRRWRALRVLEDQPGEYSYPAVIQGSDDLVHITYTWNRERVKHVVLDPADFALSDVRGHTWHH